MPDLNISDKKAEEWENVYLRLKKYQPDLRHLNRDRDQRDLWRQLTIDCGESTRKSARFKWYIIPSRNPDGTKFSDFLYHRDNDLLQDLWDLDDRTTKLSLPRPYYRNDEPPSDRLLEQQPEVGIHQKDVAMTELLERMTNLEVLFAEVLGALRSSTSSYSNQSRFVHHRLEEFELILKPENEELREKIEKRKEQS